jgi:hypothetical protein
MITIVVAVLITDVILGIQMDQQSIQSMFREHKMMLVCNVRSVVLIHTFLLKTTIPSSTQPKLMLAQKHGGQMRGFSLGKSVINPTRGRDANRNQNY